MKKILSVFAFLATMASTSLMASETNGFLYLSGGQVDIFNETTNVAKLGIGAEKVWDSNIMIGYKFGVTYATIAQEDMKVVTTNKDANMIGIELDLSLGYNIASQVSLYGTAGVLVHSIASTESGRGFGFGGGVSYQPFESFAIAVEYKTYSMETLDSTFSIDYDYDVAEIQLRYVF